MFRPLQGILSNMFMVAGGRCDYGQTSDQDTILFCLLNVFQKGTAAWERSAGEGSGINKEIPLPTVCQKGRKTFSHFLKEKGGCPPKSDDQKVDQW